MTSAFTRGIAAAAFAGALALSAAVPAFAQYYPGNGGYYGNSNNGDRQITGTVQSFGGFNMTLATNNNGNRNWNNNRRDRDNDGDRDDNGRGHGHGNNGNNGNNNGRWNNNGGYNNGGYNNNGRWNNNGGYNNGGYYNNGGMPIHLHQGTVINPTGTTLQAGMNVRVWGHPNSDGSFEADRIDVVSNNGYRGY